MSRADQSGAASLPGSVGHAGWGPSSFSNVPACPRQTGPATLPSAEGQGCNPAGKWPWRVPWGWREGAQSEQGRWESPLEGRLASRAGSLRQSCLSRTELNLRNRKERGVYGQRGVAGQWTGDVVRILDSCSRGDGSSAAHLQRQPGCERTSQQQPERKGRRPGEAAGAEGRGHCNQALVPLRPSPLTHCHSQIPGAQPFCPRPLPPLHPLSSPLWAGRTSP